MYIYTYIYYYVLFWRISPETGFKTNVCHVQFTEYYYDNMGNIIVKIGMIIVIICNEINADGEERHALFWLRSFSQSTVNVCSVLFLFFFCRIEKLLF